MTGSQFFTKLELSRALLRALRLDPLMDAFERVLCGRFGCGPVLADVLHETRFLQQGSIGDTHRRVLESAFRQLAACPVAGTTSVPAGTSTEEAVAERTTYICERGQLRCLFASPHSPPRGDLSRKGVRCFSRRAAAVAQGASPDTGERPATLTRLDACAMTE